MEAKHINGMFNFCSFCLLLIKRRLNELYLLTSNFITTSGQYFKTKAKILASLSTFVFDCCINNYHKLSSLKQHPYIVSQMVWGRNLGLTYLVLLFGS